MDQSNDKNKVVDFVEKFKTIRDLQEFARAQFITLVQANKRIDFLEIENKQLKEQIVFMKDREENGVQLITKSNEQDLCEIEIKRLKDTAFERALDLEETKRLDLLIKNLYLAKGKPKPSSGKSKKPSQISEAELVLLASSSDGSSE